MATPKELAPVYALINSGVTENGQPSFLKSWTPVRFLGKGNFGEVFEIQRGNERCALKIVEMDDNFIDMYVAELDVLNRIRDEKHAVRIEEYEILSVDRGASIQRYLAIRMNLLRKLPQFMDEESVIKLGLDMCDILAKCHSGTPKILHCDIKPDNILISSDGSYMLSDFGAAKVSYKTHNSSGNRGTPLFMSPEMHNYKGYDHRTDLYSLGVTMYSLLNGGMPPFCNGTNSAQAISMRYDGVKLPDIPGVTTGMMKILRKLCAVDPNKRYKTAQELAADLAALAALKNNDSPGHKGKYGADSYEATVPPVQNPEPVPAGKNRKKPLGVIAMSAALVAAIILGAVFLPRSGACGNSGFSKPAASSTDTTTTQPVGEKTPGVLNENTQVGDYVYFGNYPQTADSKYKPIEWRVLAAEDDNVLMISKYILDRKPYNNTETDVTWEDCALRKWLNEDFYAKAFSPEEQGRIQPRENGNIKNPYYGTDGGNTTVDNVFCLSISETERYFSNAAEEWGEYTVYPDKMAAPTDYALKNGAEKYADWGTGWWWLRSPGQNGSVAASVYASGQIDYAGRNVNNECFSVRPAILVSRSEVRMPPDLSSVSKGDYITLGSYPQTADGEEQLIEWRVLAVENNTALLISENLIDTVQYHKVEEDTTWADCSLRGWLNDEFYNNVFSSKEKEIISKRINKTPDNPTYGTPGGEDTEDYVFCLSIDEVKKYFSEDTELRYEITTWPDRMAEPTGYARKDKTLVDENLGTGYWWLRTPGSLGYGASCVRPDGAIDDIGGNAIIKCDCVRPAILISLE